MVATAAVVWFTSLVLMGPPAGAGGATESVGPPVVRLQIASFTSASRAGAFVHDHQLGWNECVLGKELGVLPPGWAELPEQCTAQTDVEVLEIQRASVRGSTVYRVVTRPLTPSELWGPLNAYRLAGFEPAVIK